MSEMVERVARAICAKTNIAMWGETEVRLDDPDYVIPGHKMTNGVPLPRWKLYVDQAVAAIEAMREPTTDMLFEGHQAAKQAHVSGITGMTIEAQTRGMASREFAAWQAMIDEALR